MYGLSWIVLAVLIILFKVWNKTYNSNAGLPTFKFMLSVIWTLHFIFGFTGFHIQPKDLSQFPAFVALHPRPLLLVGNCWFSRRSCFNKFVNPWHICMHLSICSHWMGNSFCKFRWSLSIIFIYLNLSLSLSLVRKINVLGRIRIPKLCLNVLYSCGPDCVMLVT